MADLVARSYFFAFALGCAAAARFRAGVFAASPDPARALGPARDPRGAGDAIASGRSDTRTVRCAVRFTTRNARPIGAGRIRFIDGP